MDDIYRAWTHNQYLFPSPLLRLSPFVCALVVVMKVTIATTSALVCVLGLFSYADAAKNSLTVHITDTSDYVSEIPLLDYIQADERCSFQCFILPKNRDTIGNAERPGGMKSYCTKPIKGQGYLDPGFFTKGPYIKTGTKRGPYKQITGCINPRKAPTLIPGDGGGQVDSNGGADGRGNPANSACAGCEYHLSPLLSFPMSLRHELKFPPF